MLDHTKDSELLNLNIVRASYQEHE